MPARKMIKIKDEYPTIAERRAALEAVNHQKMWSAREIEEAGLLSRAKVYRAIAARRLDYVRAGRGKLFVPDGDLRLFLKIGRA